MKTLNLLVSSVALAALAGSLSGCAPVAVGGAAVGGAMAATDRRTSSSMLDDQGIELRASRQIHDLVGGAAHVNVTSWNGRVLLSGEVPTQNDRQHAEQISRAVPGVREVINDLGVMPSSSVLTRTQDTFLTGMVKAALASDSRVAANDVKVVTERASVYLMGRVTTEEAAAAAEVASGVSGVQRVVRVFEYGVPAANTSNGYTSTTAAPVPSDMPAVGDGSTGSFYQSNPVTAPAFGTPIGTTNATTGTGSWYPATPAPEVTPAPTGTSVYAPSSGGMNGGYTAPANPYTYTAPPVGASDVYTAPAPAVQDLSPLPVQSSPVSNSPLR